MKKSIVYYNVITYRIIIIINENNFEDLYFKRPFIKVLRDSLFGIKYIVLPFLHMTNKDVFFLSISVIER